MLRTTALTLVCTTGLCIFLFAGQAAANLVSNGSFEDTTTGGVFNGQNSELGAHSYSSQNWGSNWVVTDWSQTADRIWYVTDGADNEFPDGAYAMRVDGSTPHSGVDRLQQSGISLTTGAPYTFSFDLWGEGQATTRIDAELTGPATIVLFDNETTVANDGAYEKKSTQFTPTTAGDYTLSFFVDPSGNHAWVDNVVLQSPNLIADGSFEVNTNDTPGNGQGSEIGSTNYAGSPWGNDDVLTYWDKSGTRTWYMTDRNGTADFPDGDFAYRLDGAALEGVNDLYQDGLSLTAGTPYELSFEMWGESGTPHIDVELTGPATLKLFDDETTNGTDGSAETKSTQFTPTVTGTYRIRFFADDPAGAHAWIDDASLTVVPEPSTFALAAIGLLGLLGWGWQKRLRV